MAPASLNYAFFDSLLSWLDRGRPVANHGEVPLLTGSTIASNQCDHKRFHEDALAPPQIEAEVENERIGENPTTGSRVAYAN